MRRLPPFASVVRPSVVRTEATATPFAWLPRVVAPDAAAAIAGLLERRLRAHLRPVSRGIPEGLISGQTRNWQERLPKTARMQAVELASRSGAAWRAAQATGVVAFLESDALRRLAVRAVGRALAPRPGVQALRYGPGDYSGPHTDHHPEYPDYAGGYAEAHLTFTSPAVRDQFLMWAPDGHWTEMVEVAKPGGLALYRLPFWHATTPLRAKPGREAEAYRWVLIATFRFAEPLPPLLSTMTPAPETARRGGRSRGAPLAGGSSAKTG